MPTILLPDRLRSIPAAARSSRRCASRKCRARISHWIARLITGRSQVRILPPQPSHPHGKSTTWPASRRVFSMPATLSIVTAEPRGLPDFDNHCRGFRATSMQHNWLSTFEMCSLRNHTRRSRLTGGDFQLSPATGPADRRRFDLGCRCSAIELISGLPCMTGRVACSG